jgi:hypothetical protein
VESDPIRINEIVIVLRDVTDLGVAEVVDNHKLPPSHVAWLTVGWGESLWTMSPVGGPSSGLR